jgi:glycosyltransferase involved in cell wall biosynthesis
MKRVCIDARFYAKRHTGVSRYTRALIHHLQKIASDIDYTVILTPEDHAEWPKDDMPKNWHVKILNIPFYTRAEQIGFLNYLNHEKFDLVHFTMFNHPIRYNKPFVVTIHDLTMTLFPLRSRWHYRFLAYRYTMRHAAKASAHIIVPSKATANDVESHLNVPKDKISVTYEAVEPEFKPDQNSNHLTQLKEKYGLTKPFIYFVNAWRPHKGLLDMIQAYEMVKCDHDVQLLIAGKPNPAFPEIVHAVEQAKEHLGDVVTPGFIPDNELISLYSIATAFVFPSHYEGFGLGALEAISCGAPTISADNSSLPEVLGDAALYYPTGDIAKLAEHIGTLLDNSKLQHELHEKGLKQAKKFSFDTMAEETLAVYKQVLGISEK